MNTRQNFGIFKSREDIEKIIEKIVEIGKKLNKKVVATGDVFVLDEKDMIYREILHVGQKKKNAKKLLIFMLEKRNMQTKRKKYSRN